jgi:hypothetical protein
MLTEARTVTGTFPAHHLEIKSANCMRANGTRIVGSYRTGTGQTLKEKDAVSIGKEATQFRGKREVHVASTPEDKV